MKTTRIIICILLISTINLFAQENDLKGIYKDVTTAINTALLTKSGSKEISGFLAYNYFSTKYTYNEKMTQQIFLIEPVFSYFFTDNISLGFDLSYLHQKTDYESSEDSRTIEQIFIGPITKMYFGEDRLRPFILADYLLFVGDNHDGGVLDIGAGIFYHVTGNFGFSLIGKYGFMSSTNVDIDSQNRVFIGVGISNFIL
jgi:hypothetical protein